MFKKVNLLILITIIFACSSVPKKVTPDNELFESAMSKLNKKSYLGAKKYLDELIINYPSSLYYEHSLLELAYISYISDDFINAESYAKRFQALYPNSPQLDYAIYIEASAVYYVEKNKFEDYLFTDWAQRDAGLMNKSFFIYKRLIDNYPNSSFSYDSKQRMIWIINRQAERQIRATEFFMQKKNWLTVISITRNIMKNYAKSSSIKKTLEIAYQAYDELNLTNEKQNILNILHHYD